MFGRGPWTHPKEFAILEIISELQGSNFFLDEWDFIGLPKFANQSPIGLCR